MGPRTTFLAGVVLLLGMTACSSVPPAAPVDGGLGDGPIDAGLTADAPVTAPSDDPEDYDVPAGRYRPVLSEPRFVVPSAALPPGLADFPSHNNVDILFFEDRLFMAWRTAPIHFASAETRMHLVSSPDGGETWEHEHTIAMGADVREPRFYVAGGQLRFLYFLGGTDPAAFEPQALYRITRLGPGKFTEPETFGEPDEVPWRIKVRGGRSYLSSYAGNHYGAKRAETLDDIKVFFKVADDGVDFQTVDPDRPFVYAGGVSEVAFEFTRNGDLWAVGRNEDGDLTGFGTQICFASKESLGDWSCRERSDPERYDSPEMFRHGDELYLVARRDIGGPFDQGNEELTVPEGFIRYNYDYWMRPKRSSLYRIDQEAGEVVHVLDLPGAGDTAFPSVRRTGPHSFLIANYTSPLRDPDRTWLEGQTSREGTQIYFITLTFQPEG